MVLKAHENGRRFPAARVCKENLKTSGNGH
jgi:hypothetical protein